MQTGIPMEVAVYVERDTAILVPSCFLPSEAMCARYPQAHPLCTAHLSEDPGAFWVETRMERDDYVAVPLSEAVYLLADNAPVVEAIGRGLLADAMLSDTSLR